MTDEQIFENEIKCIIRRNECVCNGGSDCIKCDLLMDSEEIVKCYNRAIKNIDLTNYQKKEIERLKKNIDELNIFTTNHIKVIRLQAIKEFVEKLTNKISIYKYVDVDGIVILNRIFRMIEDIEKEVTEEEK